jgi:hypothetical protein
MAGVEENPYKSPGNQGIEGFEHPVAYRRRGSMGILEFMMNPRSQDWRLAAVSIWALVNAATWSLTAWATWTARAKIRTAALFADLAVLASPIVLLVLARR